VKGGCGRDHGKDRKSRISQRHTADSRDGKPRHQPLRSRRIDDGAARHLSEQPDHAADRQHQADLRLRPFFRGEIDRDEGAEAGLHVRKEEDEPVEPVLAALRGMRRFGRLVRRKRHKMSVSRRAPLAIVMPVLDNLERPRDQKSKQQTHGSERHSLPIRAERPSTTDHRPPLVGGSFCSCPLWPKINTARLQAFDMRGDVPNQAVYIGMVRDGEVRLASHR